MFRQQTVRLSDSETATRLSLEDETTARVSVEDSGNDTVDDHDDTDNERTQTSGDNVDETDSNNDNEAGHNVPEAATASTEDSSRPLLDNATQQLEKVFYPRKSFVQLLSLQKNVLNPEESSNEGIDKMNDEKEVKIIENSAVSEENNCDIVA